MALKDKDPFTNKSGVICRYKCSEDGCEEEYIRESAKTFAERFKEHQKPPLQSMTIVTSQVIKLPSTILLSLEGRTRTSPEQ